MLGLLLELKTFVKWLLALTVAFACAFFATYKIYQFLNDNSELAATGGILVKIEEGMGTSDIAALLAEKGLVRDSRYFRLVARLNGLDGKLQVGVFRLTRGMTNVAIAEQLAAGQIEYVHFMLPEGYSVAKAAQKLTAEGLGEAAKFLDAARDYAPYAYMQTDNPAVLYKAEGFIFPAVYDFPLGISEAQILERMVQQFDEEIRTEKIDQSCREQNLALRDVVNLAAMVELEAVHTEEQPRIAGVFWKRLELGMPIQSDTTIQYILGEQKEIVTFDDLKIENPYNTYLNPGLPPGPIASPGLNAIKAVLEPLKSDELYFVAQKDGRHRFTRHYEEHLRAIREVETEE